MYKRRDKNTNFHVVHIAETKCSIKYISNIYGDVMQSEKKLLVTKSITFITITYIMINIYLYSTGLEYLIS